MIVQRAKELNVRMTNAQGKLKKVSAEWAGWQDLHTRSTGGLHSWLEDA